MRPSRIPRAPDDVSTTEYAHAVTDPRGRTTPGTPTRSASDPVASAQRRRTTFFAAGRGNAAGQQRQARACEGRAKVQPPFPHNRAETVSQASPHLRAAFEALVTEEYSAGHEAIGPPALAALEECSDVMANTLCEQLDLPRGSTYADGVVAYCDTVTYRDLSLSQLSTVAKESEAAGFQLGILRALCALRGERDALEAIGDDWIPLLRDAVHTVHEAELHPDGPKEFFRLRRVGRVARGEDGHPLTDDEFDAEWAWWS
jgi:hypothetical protein